MLLVARTKRSRTGSSPRPRIASEACSDAALLLADELIQGFRERRRFTGRQTHRALHLHKDHAVIARAAVRIVDLFAALARKATTRVFAERSKSGCAMRPRRMRTQYQAATSVS